MDWVDPIEGCNESRGLCCSSNLSFEYGLLCRKTSSKNPFE